MSQKPRQISFLIYAKVDRNTYFTPVFVSCISHLNPFRVRCPLQMLERFSTVSNIEQMLRTLSFLALSATRSTKNKKTTQSHRNFCTLRAIDEPFYCELVSNSADNFVRHHSTVFRSPWSDHSSYVKAN